jgi:hypothetical protein
MELLESQIEAFLSVDVGIGNGNGEGYDNGDGNGNGEGHGNGNGDGNGNGEGYGNGNGNGYGNGEGYGDGSGITEIDGYKVYKIDGTPTIITAIHGNVAQGFLLEKNTYLVPCYVVREGDNFAHGKTLHSAYAALQEKLYDDSTEEERIAAFIEKFPEYDTPYSNEDLYHYHHVLTGSCEMGRQSFINSHGLALDGTMTVRQFVELTKDAYNGDIIQQLPREYGQ